MKLLSGNRATLRVIKDLLSEHPQSTIRTKCRVVSRQTAKSFHEKAGERQAISVFFPLFFIPRVFLREISHQDRLASTIASSVDPQHPLF
jgi:hypothetical protein